MARRIRTSWSGSAEAITISRLHCSRRSAPPVQPGDTQNCSLCHTNGSEQNLPIGLNPVVDPQGWINPDPGGCGRLQRLPHVGVGILALPRQHDYARRELHGVPQRRRGVCRGSGARAVLKRMDYRMIRHARAAFLTLLLAALPCAAQKAAPKAAKTPPAAPLDSGRLPMSARKPAGRAMRTSGRHSQRALTKRWTRARRNMDSKARPANRVTGPAAITCRRSRRPTSAIPQNCLPAEADRTCMTCHRNQPTVSGRLEASHAHNDIACTSCHSIHAHGPDGLVVRKPAEINALCENCHIEVKASFAEPFKHRVPENAMTCVDCHNPHGSFKPGLMRMASANEPGCFNCHADKRGPFTFEHAPVREEGCQSCHMPHGSAECEDADPPGSAPRVPRVPREPAGCRIQRHRDWRRAAGVSRYDFAAIPELHHLPSEDSRQPYRQEPAAMKSLLLLGIPASVLFAQTPRLRRRRSHNACAGRSTRSLGLYRSRLSLGRPESMAAMIPIGRSSISGRVPNCWARISRF